MSRTVLAIALGTALLLGACAEKPQTAATKKSDVPPFQGAQNGFSAPGWTAGDKTGWEQQLRQRSQGQNEYLRSAAAKP